MSFPLSTISTKLPFELVHVDTWGPYHTKTYIGYRYFLTIVDDYTRATWTRLMVNKDEAIELIKSFVKMAQTQFNGTVKILRTDNAQKQYCTRILCFQWHSPSNQLCTDSTAEWSGRTKA